LKIARDGSLKNILGEDASEIVNRKVQQHLFASIMPVKTSVKPAA